MSTLTKPYTFAGATYAVASQVNSDFDTLYGWVNASAIWADASVAFTNTPSGPAADPTAPNHLVRKSYVDARMVGTTRIQVGNIVGSTNVNGAFTFSFPQAFPTTVGGVVLSMGDKFGQYNVQLEFSTLTLSGGTIYVYNTTTGVAAPASTAVRVNYIAFGT